MIRVPGGRALDVELLPLSPDTSDELIAYLGTFWRRGWHKALVFCNSRAEVESYAASVRARSPFGGAVFVHYSNIDARRRREIEQQFAEAGVAICFASSTLELGIDVGNIDTVILIGPPGGPGSFVQRIGRGNRRARVTHGACFYRTPLERLLFEALLASQGSGVRGQGSDSDESQTQNSALKTQNSRAAFRPAVAIQQIFSLIKQSPTAAVRLAELSSLFAGMLSRADLEAIIGELQRRRYLSVGRPGEWRPGERLNALFDEQTRAQVSLSIYSNIQVGDTHMIDIRDQHTQQTVARVDAAWLDRPLLTLEGRPVNVEWCDGEVMLVASYQGQDMADRLVYRSARQLLSYELARLLPAQLGLPPGAAPFVVAPEGWWWFHWLGDLYGRAALDLLRYRVPATETEQIGLYLLLSGEPQAPPAWTQAQVVRYLEDNYRKLEPLLALGPFQQLLPLALRRRAVVEQFDVVRFLEAVADLRPLAAPESLAEPLIELISEKA